MIGYMRTGEFPLHQKGDAKNENQRNAVGSDRLSVVGGMRAG